MSPVQVVAAYRFIELGGGIVRDFEAAPGAPHWHGRCFVCDERHAPDANLEGVAA